MRLQQLEPELSQMEDVIFPWEQAEQYSYQAVPSELMRITLFIHLPMGMEHIILWDVC